MKVLVLLKRVPDTGTKLSVNDGKNDIVRDGVPFVTNPFDEYAIEDALANRERLGALELVAVSLGAHSTDVLRNALALGADRAVNIQADERSPDSFTVAGALADVVRSEAPRLVFCGKQAVDSNNAAVGPQVAALLGWGLVTEALKTELSEGSIRVERESPQGRVVVELPLPAVVTFEKGQVEPRLPALMGIMQAKKKPVEELSPSLPAARVIVETASLPGAKQAGAIFNDPFPANVDALLGKLKEAGL